MAMSPEEAAKQVEKNAAYYAECVANPFYTPEAVESVRVAAEAFAAKVAAEAQAQFAHEAYYARQAQADYDNAYYYDQA